jgi:hypothetical protein
MKKRTKGAGLSGSAGMITNRLRSPANPAFTATIAARLFLYLRRNGIITKPRRQSLLDTHAIEIYRFIVALAFAAPS